MNNCCFTGYLAENPYTDYEGDALKAEFVVVVYSYRKNKATGDKIKMPTYIQCEAWHTGAETIERFAKRGTKITIHASAKNVSKEDDCVIFRVNEFDICHQANFEE
jgi:single-stranded DNA-binding protein